MDRRAVCVYFGVVRDGLNCRRLAQRLDIFWYGRHVAVDTSRRAGYNDVGNFGGLQVRLSFPAKGKLDDTRIAQPGWASGRRGADTAHDKIHVRYRRIFRGGADDSLCAGIRLERGRLRDISFGVGVLQCGL